MRTISTTWKHVRRAPYQALAAILTMFITFLVGGIFLLTTTSSAIILRYFESKPQITVFFSDKATTDEAMRLKTTVERTGKTTSVKYVSQDEALKIYQEQNKGDPLLLEMVTSDILPASLEIYALEPKFLSELDSVVRQAPNVEEVVYQRDIVESLLQWTNAVRGIGGILAVLLSVNALLVVMTIVNMKIALRKDEVEILNLVGASRWYIKLPFVLEGGFYGAIGAAFAAITIICMVVWFRPALWIFLNVIPAFNTLLASATSSTFIIFLTEFGFLFLLLGFLLGSIGSLIALARYLRF